MNGVRFVFLTCLFCLVFQLPTLASVASRSVSPSETFSSGMFKVERFGNTRGPALVFIPALYCGSWQWNAQIDALSPRYDVYVVTLPGFDGRSMVRGTGLMRRAADSLRALVLERRMRRAIIVGHSLGGTLAVLYAETFPHDLGAVITVEGGLPVAPTAQARAARIAAAVRPFEGISRASFGAVLRRTQLQYVITRSTDVDAVEPLAAKSDPAAVVAWLRAALSLDLTPRLSNISVPFTAIVPFDPTIDPYNGFANVTAKSVAYQQWVSHVRGGRLVMIAPSRHFVMFDRPATFESMLERTLTQDVTAE